MEKIRHIQEEITKKPIKRISRKDAVNMISLGAVCALDYYLKRNPDTNPTNAAAAYSDQTIVETPVSSQSVEQEAPTVIPTLEPTKTSTPVVVQSPTFTPAPTVKPSIELIFSGNTSEASANRDDFPSSRGGRETEKKDTIDAGLIFANCTDEEKKIAIRKISEQEAKYRGEHGYEQAVERTMQHRAAIDRAVSYRLSPFTRGELEGEAYIESKGTANVNNDGLFQITRGTANGTVSNMWEKLESLNKKLKAEPSQEVESKIQKLKEALGSIQGGNYPDVRDPLTGAIVASAYLGNLYDIYGDMGLSLWGYNFGGHVDEAIKIYLAEKKLPTNINSAFLRANNVNFVNVSRSPSVRQNWGIYIDTTNMSEDEKYKRERNIEENRVDATFIYPFRTEAARRMMK